MDKEIIEGLRGFEEVWKRVRSGAAPAAAEPRGVKLMPRRGKRSSGTRFIPPK